MTSFAAVFAGLGVPQVWVGRSDYTIIDTAFGEGHLFLHLWHAWRLEPQRSRRLHVVGLLPELCPAQELQARLLQTCPADIQPFVQELVEAWPLNLLGVHRLEFERLRVTLTLAVGDASIMLGRVSARADAVVFPPEARDYPDVKLEPLLAAATRLLAPGGKLVRLLMSATKLRENCSEQASALWGQGTARGGVWSRGEGAQSAVSSGLHEGHQHVVVVGGGFAGASVAHALSLRGWAVTVYEASGAEQTPHRGHLAAALTPMLTREDDIRARLSRAGTLLGHRRWGHLTGEAFDCCGALQLSRRSGRIVDLESVVAGLNLPEAWAKFVDASQASAIAGIHLQRGGIYFPMAVRVQPELFLDQLLNGPNILRRKRRVQRIVRCGEVWQVLDAAGEVFDESRVVVVAAAHATQDILSASGLLSEHARLRMMHRLGGEVTYVPEGLLAGGPRCIVSGDGYVLPAVDGYCVTGSSYLHGAELVSVTDAGARENLKRAEGLLGTERLQEQAGHGPTLGWAGWRAVLPGRLPAVGAVGQDAGLWAVTGLASRGLTWSSLAGDLVAATLNAEPLPLETDIIDKISQI